MNKVVPNDVRNAANLSDALLIVQQLNAPLVVLTVRAAGVSGELWIAGGKEVCFALVWPAGGEAVSDMLRLLQVDEGAFDIGFREGHAPVFPVPISIDEILTDKTEVVAKVRIHWATAVPGTAPLPTVTFSRSFHSRSGRHRIAEDELQRQKAEFYASDAPKESNLTLEEIRSWLNEVRQEQGENAKTAPSSVSESGAGSGTATRYFMRERSGEMIAKLTREHIRKGQLPSQPARDDVSLVDRKFGVSRSNHAACAPPPPPPAKGAKLVSLAGVIAILVCIAGFVFWQSSTLQSQEEQAQERHALRTAQNETGNNRAISGGSQSHSPSAAGNVSPGGHPTLAQAPATVKPKTAKKTGTSSLPPSERSEIARQLAIGDSLMESNRPQEALAVYSELVRKYPHEAGFRMLLAQANIVLGRVDVAKAVYQEGMNLARTPAEFKLFDSLLQGSIADPKSVE